ncbi:STAS domain-containing protein [Streptomyces sp. ALB3]|uniref:STAS domain-containing protein n=1 Tax=Streptomyces sp. ALB3 TaxID=3374278 RepID=UPI0037B2F190
MFSVQVRPVTGAVVLQLRGELDFESVVQLYEAGETALATRPVPRLVVVDCVSMTFCDSSGIGGLVRLYQRLSAQGGQLRLAAPPAPVAKVLSLTGLDAVIAVDAGVDEALAAARGGRDGVAGGTAGKDGREAGAG